MSIIKHSLRLISLLAAIVLPSVAFAVTQQEMEQAQAIAAKIYLRWSNDGSGYLDNINPKNLAELEKQLNKTEVENLKAFKAISFPSDYKNWDKKQLVEFWSVTAFQNNNLLASGKRGASRVKTQLNKLNISAPSTQQQTKETPSATTSQPSEAQQQEELADSIAALAEIDSAVIDNDLMENEADEVQKEKNYTWVYIMVLCILVALVVALVIYGVKVMKKSGDANTSSPNHNEDLGIENEEELRAHFNGIIADKDIQIAMLNNKLESASRQNSELKAKLEGLTAEIAHLRSMKTTVSEPAPAPIADKPEPKRSPLKTIYLGRANAKGIFVRADRTLNVGNSVFVLNTTDGFSGTFHVADSPAAWSLALSNPAEYLKHACTGEDLDDSDGASRIVTESSGTAVFEGGCWRVIRKAKIRYE